MPRLHLRVRGRVQGVGFRYFVRETARELGLSGWVRNRPDGSVELRADGPEDAVAALVAAVERGPGGAVVGAVDHVTPNVETRETDALPFPFAVHS